MAVAAFPLLVSLRVLRESDYRGRRANAAVSVSCPWPAPGGVPAGGAAFSDVTKQMCTGCSWACNPKA